MRILVIGSGGREHALIKSFRLSPLVTEIHAIPGNDGMKKEALCHTEVTWRNFEAIVDFCFRHEIDFVFIGPEDPLVHGLSDFLRSRGIHCIGPDQEAAQLEGSKIFAKSFMIQAGVPTAPFQVIDSVESALTAAQNFSPPYVLKADGLCAGKGVAICRSLDDLKKMATAYFIDRIFSEAGSQAVLEQFMPGFEVSYTVLTNGVDFVSLPVAQDHKRLGDGDTGPNTGGMGTVAPIPLDPNLESQIQNEIVRPTLKQMQKRHFLFRGVLFIGIMVTPQGPKVIEYNVRFGDPETQVLLPLMDGDAADFFLNLAKGQISKLKIRSLSAACVVMAAKGYPENPARGLAISGPLELDDPNQWVIHAGTKKFENQFLTNGGRVLGCVGVGDSTKLALLQAYDLTSRIQSEGLIFRKDIGAKVLVRDDSTQR
jgi:phosphoribosylamine--glycine ligase